MKFDKNFAFSRNADAALLGQDDTDDPHKGVMVEFYETSRPMHDANGLPVTGANGEPVMSQPVLMIRYHTVGDPVTKFNRKAVEADKREFAKAYQMFQQGKSFQEQSGTSLDLLADMDIMNKAMLQTHGLFTIELLANCPESSVLQTPALRNWVHKARSHIQLHKPKPNQELLDEMAAMKAELAALKAAKTAKTNQKEAA